MFKKRERKFLTRPKLRVVEGGLGLRHGSYSRV